MRVSTLPIALVLAAAATGCSLFASRGPFPALSWDDLEAREAPHRVAMLDSGWEALAVRVHLIREAESSIDLQTFIWRSDEVGNLLVYELVQAARRGVKVRLVVDQMFSLTDPELVAFVSTAHPNLLLKHHNPSRDRISSTRLAQLAQLMIHFKEVNQRAHGKVMVVDGKSALIGGRNLENTYFDYAPGMNYKDREILVEGPVVQDVVASFERFWAYERCITSADLNDVAPLIRSGAYERFETPDDYLISELLRELEPWTAPVAMDIFLEDSFLDVDDVAFSCDEPGKPAESNGEDPLPNPVLAVLGGLVRGAQDSVLIQSPYLVLNERSVRLFADLREEHPDVSVRISTNSLAATDSWQTYAMSYRQKRTMLQKLKFQIFEYKPRPTVMEAYLSGHARADAGSSTRPRLCMHAKSLVLDDEIAAIGSFNLDPRSSHLNTEVMVLVLDTEFAARLAASIESDAHPRNSWTIWKRAHPIVESQFRDLLDMLNHTVAAITTIDLWPSQYATSFDLISGMDAVPPGHPDFYECYREVGDFPEVDIADQKLLLTRLLKTFGTSADWLL
jgi:putative cardiolipin synthase